MCLHGPPRKLFEILFPRVQRSKRSGCHSTGSSGSEQLQTLALTTPGCFCNHETCKSQGVRRPVLGQDTGPRLPPACQSKPLPHRWLPAPCAAWPQVQRQQSHQPRAETSKRSQTSYCKSSGRGFFWSRLSTAVESFHGAFCFYSSPLMRLSVSSGLEVHSVAGHVPRMCKALGWICGHTGQRKTELLRSQVRVWPRIHVFASFILKGEANDSKVFELLPLA